MPTINKPYYCLERFVEKKYKRYLLIAGLFLFILYVFIGARPIPPEMVLVPQQITSLESTFPLSLENDQAVETELIPFTLGNRFGYVDIDGKFTLNQVQKGYVSLSPDYWADYNAVPSTIEVHSPYSDTVITIPDNQGYPIFLDNRIFIVSNEQQSLREINTAGTTQWVYDFAAPLTVFDVSTGLVLAGTLDGTVELLDNQGTRVFFFEPGGSRLAVIVGCAISDDATKLAIVSGIDQQRFLLLERFGDAITNDYKVVHHEFLRGGFRRAVHVMFVDNDNRIAFEREGALGLYDISNRISTVLPLEGEITAIENSGTDMFLFVITAQSTVQRHLVTVLFPGTVIMEAPFKSESTFLARSSSRLFVGGGSTLALFALEKR
jgi:hypothetical protein